MRQGGPNGRRPRGRHHGAGNGGNGNAGNGGNNGGSNRPRSAASLRHQTFDSNGPDIRVRGNAWQVYEKYQSLARDASSAGDRVAAENYQQHAEHYYRIIEAINDATAMEQRQRGGFNAPQQPDVPANYYAPDGSLMPSDAAPQTDPAAMGPAEVQPKAAPPSPFFTPEEVEDHQTSLIPMAAGA